MIDEDPRPVEPQPAAYAPWDGAVPVAAQAPAAPRSSLPLTTLIVLILAAGIATAAVSAAVVTLSRNSAPQAASATAPPAASGQPAPSQSALPLATIYKQDAPGVVTITTEAQRNGRTGQGVGSGVVVDMRGDIVTNSHVIVGAQQIQVTFADGQSVAATVVTNDPADDLAVLNVSVASSRLHPIPLGNSDTVLVGDSVAAIGSPFDLPGTMTEGIVSGLHRSNPGTATSGTGISAHDLIQTDAPINPGNSGGPLLNTLGQVIGINESIQGPINGNVGVGFAVPINQVLKLLPSLGGANQ